MGGRELVRASLPILTGHPWRVDLGGTEGASVDGGLGRVQLAARDAVSYSND